MTVIQVRVWNIKLMGMAEVCLGRVDKTNAFIAMADTQPNKPRSYTTGTICSITAAIHLLAVYKYLH